MRAVTGGRLVVGGALLLAAGPALTLVGGPDRADHRVRTVARVLGGRLVLQGLGALALGPRFHRAGLLVEFAHAASMLPIVALSERHRRSAAVSLLLATGLLLADVRAGEGESPPSGANRA